MKMKSFITTINKAVALIIIMAGLGFNSYAQYCNAGPTSTLDTEITGVTLLGAARSISNLNTCPAGTGLTDFTQHIADVVLSNSYNVSVEFGTCGGQYNSVGAVWIDWNNDNTFSTNEQIGTWTGLPPMWQTFNFTVPTTAVLGTTRMRAMIWESGFHPLNPCGIFTYGGVEDYTINILATPPPCPNPTNLAVTNQDTNSVSLSWTTGGAAAWNIQYGTSGFSIGGGAIINNVSTSNYTVSNLPAGTPFDFYVQDTCGGGNGSSFWTGPTAAVTSINATHSQSFDNATIPNLPGGWSDILKGFYTFSTVSATTANGSLFGDPTSYNGPNYLKLETTYGGTTADTIYCISPNVLDVNTGLNRLRFRARSPQPVFIQVGVMTDPLNPGSFVSLATVNIQDQWDEHLVKFSSYSGPLGSIAIKYYNTTTFTNIDAFIDDLTWEPIPIHDVGVTQKDNPVNPITFGTQNVEVTVQNFGVDTLSNAIINWSINGAAQPSYNLVLTGSNQLAVDQTKSNIQIGAYNFTKPLNILKAWTESPNSFVDEVASNDTLRSVICSGLSGVYTVGTPNDSFPNIELAIDALKNCGLVGPTSLVLSAGNYTKKIELNNIMGLSAANHLTIEGASKTGSILTSDGLGTNNATILVDSSSFITFKNMTIKNEGTNLGRGIMVRFNSNNITVDNCIIEATNPTANTNLQVVGVFMGPSFTSNFTEGDNGDNLVVNNCTFIGTQYGVQIEHFLPDPGKYFSITDCNFIDNQDAAINVDNVDSLIVKGNYMSSSITFNGLLASDVRNFEFTDNEFHSLNEPFNMSRGNDTLGFLGTFTNNMLSSLNQEATSFFNVNSTQMFHNTFYGTEGINLNGAQSVDMRNNIFIGKQGYAIRAANASFVQFDYNLYYTSGPDLFFYNNVINTDLAALNITLPIYNFNSLVGDPQILGPTNLHIVYGTLANDNGDNSIGLAIDIDGDARPAPLATAVDIGADEYTLPPKDLGLVELLSQQGPCYSDTDMVVLKITNNGQGNLDFAADSFLIHWNISGPTPSIGSQLIITDSLAQNDTAIITLTNLFDFSGYGTYEASFYIQAAWDSTNLNDTLSSIEIISPNLLTASGDVTITLPGDSAQLVAISSTQSKVLFSEIVQFKTGSGFTNPIPAYMPTFDWDMVEIANIGGGVANLSGYTVEIYGASGLDLTYTIPSGANIGAYNVLTVGYAFSAGANSLVNNMYWSTNTFSTSSNVQQGYVLKDASNNIVDAVATNSFIFPTTAGVSATDWTGSLPSSSGMAGISRYGADTDGASDWTLSSATPQTIGTFNPGLDSSLAASINWYLDTNLIDTNATTNVGPFFNNGVLNYVASINTQCGLILDTVFVNVDIPYADTGLVDIVIDSIGTSTQTACNISSSDVQIHLTNTGTDTVYWVPASFSINNGAAVNQLFVDTLYPNIQKTLTFSSLAPFGGTGNQNIKAWVNVPGDTLHVNDTNSIILNNLQLPNTPIASADTNYCPGDVVSPISAIGSGGTLTWYSDASLDSSFTLSYNSSYQASSTVGVHTYYITETDQNGCESYADTVVVGVRVYPVISAGGNTSVCIGSSRTINASGGASYVWSTGGNSNSILISPIITTQYSVIGTDQYGCIASDTIMVTIDSLPNVSIPSIPNVCANSTPISLSGGLPVGGIYSGPNVSNGLFNPSLAGVGQDSVAYMYTDGNGCSNLAKGFITVDTIPSVSMGAFQNYCDNAPSVTLTGGIPLGGVYTGPGILNGLFNPSNAGSPGNKLVKYTFTDLNGCSNSVIKTIQLLESPTVNFGAFGNICENYSPLPISGGSPNGGVYSGNGIVNDTLYPALAGPGNNQLTYTFTNSVGCTNLSNSSILIEAIPSTPIINKIGIDSLEASVVAPLYIWSYEGQTYPGNLQYIVALLSGRYQVTAVNGTCNSQKSEYFYFELVSINDVFENNELKVYPNPSDGIVNIENKNNEISSVQMHTLNGSLIESIKISNNGSFQTVNFTSLANGFYILSVTKNSEVYHFRIAKQ